jgi:alpha-amylase/alpha-mannosidase (GH57 family)
VIRFALYIHNHQPTGNFEEVFEYAYTHSYLPLLKAFLKHDQIKFGIHNSGILMEWILKKHPEYIEMLKETTQRGQSEILTSAYAEPILSFIPRKDVVSQIQYHTDFINKHFDFQPHGLWLTERIWEPQLISTLCDAGIEYILLDDTHFNYAGLDTDDLYSYYITEDEGRKLSVFPISMKLRYLIPFHPIDETFEFFQAEATKRQGVLKTLGDDGEKFGVWPGTYDWVYTKAWLDEFLSRLSKEKWVHTVLLKDMLSEPPAGTIYLPTSSYEEMGEWVLPPQRGIEYEELKNTIDNKYYYLIHGGYFRNFLRKYPEANHMQKRMLYVSKHLAQNKEARMALWRGQCSCAYWHGIFGGLYLPHLREAIYRNLIEAENYNIIPTCIAEDFNADGREEIVISNDGFFIVMNTRSGSFIEIDDRNRKLNLLNFIGRRKEKYHMRIAQHAADQDVKSIHEISRSMADDLARHLVYDTYERSSGLDRILEDMPTAEDFYRGIHIGRIVDYSRYDIAQQSNCTVNFNGTISKMIEIGGASNRMIQMKYSGDIELFGIEFSFGIFDTGVSLNDTYDIKEKNTLEHVEKLKIQGTHFSPLIIEADHPFDLLTYPIETISSSESGFERNFQGVCLLLIFKNMPLLRMKI